MAEPSFVIVGAGLAGARAAQSLRKQGFGGRVTVVGAEQYLPYDRPPLSKGVLAGPYDAMDTTLHSAEYWAEQHVDLVLGEQVVALRRTERSVELADGRTIPADKVLLSTGGRARRLDVAGSDLAGVWCLRTIDDARGIRASLRPDARIVVVGAGFVGAEVAATARALGCEVTLVELGPVPLWRVLGPELGRVFGDMHREEGVRVLTGVGVTDLRGDDRVRSVGLSDGSIIDADLVVVGVGIEAHAELAEQIGARVGNGIVVDEFCETSVPGIYAAGDVANHPNEILGDRVRLEHWQNAQNQAAAAASSMLGQRTPFREVPWFWSDQYDVNLQVAGHLRADDETVWRGNPGGRSFVVFYRSQGRVRAVAGVNRRREVRAGMDLVASAARVSAEVLADEDVDLRALARGLAAST